MSGAFQKGSPRMFDSALLEKLSRVHPAVPAMLFGPIVALMMWAAVTVDGTRGLALLGHFVGGYAFWTLLEYWLHRLIFHLPVRGPRSKRAYFFIHGVHHDYPWDQSRLVMPPAVSILLAILFYGLFRAVLGPAMHAAYAGVLFGYALYDTIHWYTHAGRPKNRVMKFLRREHMIHHFKESESESRFGVTCPYWDVVFRTTGRPSVFARYAETRFLWVDVVTMSYMAGAGLLHLFLGAGRPGWIVTVLLHAAYVAAGFEIVRASQRRPGSWPLAELRTWYPAFVILYGFFSATMLQDVLSNGEFWGTRYLVDADLALFGVHPTVWLQQLHRPWLDELMSFLNLSYYLIPFLYAVPLVMAGRREAVWAGASIALLAYVANYTLFLFLPALGPRMVPAIEALRPSELHGGLFAWLVGVVQGEQGTVRGAAFPSAHVSAAIAWAMVGWRYERRLAFLLWPLAIGTTLSTVYLGLHHAVDPIAGLVVGVICYFVGLRILRARGEDPLTRSAAASVAVPSAAAPSAPAPVAKPAVAVEPAT